MWKLLPLRQGLSARFSMACAPDDSTSSNASGAGGMSSTRAHYAQGVAVANLSG